MVLPSKFPHVRDARPLPPASVSESDNLNAGSLDTYPRHFQDQFLLIEGIPSGVYWFEDEINPGGIMWESDYTNNSMFLMIAIDQEARRVDVIIPPDDSFASCPAP